MALSAVVLSTTLLAFGPQWAIVDLPYPEVAEAAPVLDARIAEAVAAYARTRPCKGNARHEILPLRIEAESARVRLIRGERSEILVLARVKDEWRVVQSLSGPGAP